MLNDKQSLLLCGLLAGGVFVTGILDVFSNFIVLTILTLAFLAIIVNIFLTHIKSKENEQTDIK